MNLMVLKSNTGNNNDNDKFIFFSFEIMICGFVGFSKVSNLFFEEMVEVEITFFSFLI